MSPADDSIAYIEQGISLADICSRRLLCEMPVDCRSSPREDMK